MKKHVYGHQTTNRQIRSKIEKFNVSLRTSKRDQIQYKKIHKHCGHAHGEHCEKYGGKLSLEEVIKHMENDGFFAHSDFQ